MKTRDRHQPAAPLHRQGPAARAGGIAGHGNQAVASALGLQGSGAVQGIPLPVRNPLRQFTVDEDALATITDDVMGAVPKADAEGARKHVAAILRQAALAGVRNSNQVAYLLATAEHESHFGHPRFSWSEPLVEEGNKISKRRDGKYTSKVHRKNKRVTGKSHDEVEKKYWDTLYGGRLGNRKGTSDAANYRGRGYAQLTGRRNYRDMSRRLNESTFGYEHDGKKYGGKSGVPIDLESNPTHVNEVPDLAGRVLVTGAMEGRFTGRSVPDYVDKDSDEDPFGERNDFYDARSVINGDKGENGQKIAVMARKYAQTLSGAWSLVFVDKADAN